MRLIGCVNVYQDGPLLARTLPALRRVVDFLVVVDGAYEGFRPYSSLTAASVDDTIPIALMHADAVVLPPYASPDRRVPWRDEVEKRSAYLEFGEPGDYHLVVDADEVVEVLRGDGTVDPIGHVDVATLVERDDWMVWLKRAGDSTRPYAIHRLFRHRAGIRYRGAHHAVHVGAQMIHPSGLEAELPDSAFPRLRLSHLWDQRDHDRVERKGEYYRESLNASEHEFRKAHGL